MDLSQITCTDCPAFDIAKLKSYQNQFQIQLKVAENLTLKCPSTVKPSHAVTCIKRSSFSCPVI